MSKDLKTTGKFYDNALLKLHRKYGKDELVLSLKKQISEKDIEIGKLKSEIDFLSAELSDKKEKKEIMRQANVKLKADELFLLKEKECKIHLKKIDELRKSNKELIMKLNHK